MARQQLGTAPANAPDAATKGYVDTSVAARAPQITVSTTAPSNPAVNDIWIDTN